MDLEFKLDKTQIGEWNTASCNKLEKPHHTSWLKRLAALRKFNSRFLRPQML